MQSKLYDIRKSSKHSQEDLAKQLGISRNSYGKKERDEIPFNSDEMFALSQLFQKSLNEIFLPRSNRNGYKEKEHIT
ncbi:MAG: helix-turn-helix transcriptional regulator [Streptococcaceae bacterium]|nr:helix-turn-helix transcriptional regulator [Streptococcaceae bacterium]